MTLKDFFNTFYCEVIQPIAKAIKVGRWFESKAKVALLPLKGVIGGHGMPGGSEHFSFNDVQELIDRAFDMKGLKAVALEINSPGGSPVQSAKIQQYIRAKAQESDVPVYSFCEDVAASGGYWLACTGDEIYADESSIIGSIGVIAAGFGFTKIIEKHGIERRVYTQGENKAMLDPFLPEKEQDVQMLLDAQKDVHEVFKAYVKERRGDMLADNEQLFTGAFFSGVKAKELGLVDGIGHFDTVIKEKFGDNIKCIRLEEEKGFVQKLIGMRSLNAENIVSATISKMEARLQWNRFGI